MSSHPTLGEPHEVWSFSNESSNPATPRLTEARSARSCSCCLIRCCQITITNRSENANFLKPISTSLPSLVPLPLPLLPFFYFLVTAQLRPYGLSASVLLRPSSVLRHPWPCKPPLHRINEIVVPFPGVPVPTIREASRGKETINPATPSQHSS